MTRFSISPLLIVGLLLFAAGLLLEFIVAPLPEILAIVILFLSAALIIAGAFISRKRNPSQSTSNKQDQHKSGN